MHARMNETGQPTARRRGRYWATTAALLVCACAPVPALAKDVSGPPPEPPGQAKKQANEALVGQTAAPGPTKQAAGRAGAGGAPARADRGPRPGAGRGRPAVAVTPPALLRAPAAAAPASAPAIAVVASRTTARRDATQARRAAARRSARRRAARRAAARRAAARRAAPLRDRRVAVAAPPAPVAAASAPVAASNSAPSSPERETGAGAPDSGADDGDRVNVVTRTVRDIAEVLPEWAKALMLALGALLAVAAALIVGGGLRHRRVREQREALLNEVGVLQAAVLPAAPDRIGSLAVSVAYRPAEGIAAGGDFYDVFPLDRERVGIVVGDVSGHGHESIGAATFTRHMVRSYLEAGLGPRAALQLAGKVVDEQKREDFATVVAALYDPVAGTLAYATAGHPPPIILGAGGHRPLTVASSPPIGVGNPTGLRQTTLPVSRGTRVCFFTDGIVEARDGGGIFGTPRLEALLADMGPEPTADALVAAVAREADILRDDIAVCIIRPTEGDAVSTVRAEEIEAALPELHGRRVRRFLAACEVPDAEIERTIAIAAARAATDGSVVLRVRLADRLCGVDVLPVSDDATAAPLTALHAR